MEAGLFAREMLLMAAEEGMEGEEGRQRYVPRERRGEVNGEEKGEGEGGETGAVIFTSAGFSSWTT